MACCLSSAAALRSSSEISLREMFDESDVSDVVVESGEEGKEEDGEDVGEVDDEPF